jgi:hypothetical protein
LELTLTQEKNIIDVIFLQGGVYIIKAVGLEIKPVRKLVKERRYPTISSLENLDSFAK